MAVSPKKTKIVLSDYNYHRDIDNRLLMAELSTFEVDVLRELVNGSLRTSIADLADHLQVQEQTIIDALNKLSKTNLLSINNDDVFVNKELRKYYESQIVKFDDDFEPGVDYLLGLLSKVSIHTLPSWYSIPRTSDNIFNSLIEKYLLTPKVYQKYLDELVFDDAVLSGIMSDVFGAPGYKVRAKVLREKYALTREKFEECMLLLEFSFACCLSYARVGDQWKEVVTPFYEWREYLMTLQEVQPKPLADGVKVARRHPSDFGFIEDLSLILTKASESPLAVEQRVNKWVFRGKGLPSDNQSAIVDKLLFLDLAEVTNGQLKAKGEASHWLKMSIYDRAMAIYRYPMDWSDGPGRDAKVFTDRNVRVTEKSLKPYLNMGWIDLDDYIKGAIIPLGDGEPITLKRIARNRWKYVFPTYSDQERMLIRTTLFDRLYEVGIIAPGTYDGRECFTVTTFGRIALGE